MKKSKFKINSRLKKKPVTFPYMAYFSLIIFAAVFYFIRQILILKTQIKITFKNQQQKIEKQKTIKQKSIAKITKLTATDLYNKYKDNYPTIWDEKMDGITTTLQTTNKVLALTLDACDASENGVDRKLINFLQKNKIPATLFLNKRWIEKNYDEFMHLSTNPLFEIENHGLYHKPASVNGNSIYGITGTSDIFMLYDEVVKNADYIENLTGKRPKFYRSGTAYYDDVAVKIIRDMGFFIGGFSILGDMGATLTARKVETALLKSKPGDIIICHMNKPKSGTADGLISVIPKLMAKGYRFVRLDEYVK